VDGGHPSIRPAGYYTRVHSISRLIKIQVKQTAQLYQFFSILIPITCTITMRCYFLITNNLLIWRMRLIWCIGPYWLTQMEVAGVGFHRLLSVCFFIRYLKNDATRVTKLDTHMFEWRQKQIACEGPILRLKAPGKKFGLCIRCPKKCLQRWFTCAFFYNITNVTCISIWERNCLLQCW